MSKMDAVRAMREARYAENQARATRSGPAARRVKPANAVPVAPVPADGTDEGADEGLCGHRNMSGRTCTRERGHAAKSHRYS
ncbi:hypothetical protein FHP29_11820 [Nocardioides albidus]|uniref:Uncharacterized protein n=1 Tax=Nocardioides albidus TaxID=1517589 RepID=A0A5C4VUJ7_9ACTN|nr:hypothetical protein [Nocardioides albidus]TNM39563.1 hypothetical protein FHP29_11820 [Nocardioides albidus]